MSSVVSSNLYVYPFRKKREKDRLFWVFAPKPKNKEEASAPRNLIILSQTPTPDFFRGDQSVEQKPNGFKVGNFPYIGKVLAKLQNEVGAFDYSRSAFSKLVNSGFFLAVKDKITGHPAFPKWINTVFPNRPEYEAWSLAQAELDYSLSPAWSSNEIDDFPLKKIKLLSGASFSRPKKFKRKNPK